MIDKLDTSIICHSYLVLCVVLVILESFTSFLCYVGLNKQRWSFDAKVGAKRWIPTSSRKIHKFPRALHFLFLEI